MIYLEAAAVSRELLLTLESKYYPVHSSFQKGFNLDLGNRLCFVGNHRNQRFPYGILLKGEQEALLEEAIKAKERCFFWDVKRRRLVSGRVTVLASLADTYSSRLFQCRNGNVKKVSNAVQRLPQAELWEEQTGFGSTIGQMMPGMQVGTRDLLLAISGSNSVSIEQTLKKWVGAGPGLTPSGDDFLLGLLFVHYVCSPLFCSQSLRILRKLFETGHTTKVSVHFYRCGLEGMFSGPWQDFWHELRTGCEAAGSLEEACRLEKAAVKIRELTRFGHTSGKDMTAGMLAGFMSLSDSGIINAVNGERQPWVEPADASRLLVSNKN